MVLAQLLKPFHDVQIIGPKYADRIWYPFPDDLVPITARKALRYPAYKKLKEELAACADGDVIYAVKPRPSSFGIGLEIASRNNKPLILDIDDDEIFLFHLYEKFCLGIFGIFSPDGYYHTKKMQSLIPQSDCITAASEYFANRFGGFLIPHARDHEFLNPDLFNKDRLKRKFGLHDYFVIMFLGTPRPHKGIETIISVMKHLRHINPILALIGADKKRMYVRFLNCLGKQFIYTYPEIKFSEIPRYLAIADLVVLFQKHGGKSVGQVPAKIIDAMMMEKPIIASTASHDLENILHNCGWIIDYNSIEKLKNTILEIHANPADAQRIAKNARLKAIESYSLEANYSKMKQVIESVSPP
ncbi:glycosyltransferase [bacterium]|nr:glycosyltransferase [candidate division CSSED10-310 bacterium]